MMRYSYCVEAVSPVSLYVVAVALTVVRVEYEPVPAGDRLSIRWPVFPVETSVQARLICVDDVAVAVSPVGVAGIVNLLEALLYAELPAALTAATRYSYCVLSVRPVLLKVVLPAARLVICE